MLASPSRHHSPRQIHHLDFISQFNLDIRFIKGASNDAADALSLEVDALNTVPESTSQLDFYSMARVQQDNPDLLNSSSLKLHAVPVPTADTTLLCDMSTGTPHQHRLLYSMVRGHSYPQHHNSHSHAGICFQLDCSFRQTIHDYHRLGGTV